MYQPDLGCLLTKMGVLGHTEAKKFAKCLLFCLVPNSGLKWSHYANIGSYLIFLSIFKKMFLCQKNVSVPICFGQRWVFQAFLRPKSVLNDSFSCNVPNSSLKWSHYAKNRSYLMIIVIFRKKWVFWAIWRPKEVPNASFFCPVPNFSLKWSHCAKIDSYVMVFFYF